MSTGIRGLLQKREPMQWVDGEFVVVKQTKKSPGINPGNPKPLATVTTSENKGSSSNVCK